MLDEYDIIKPRLYNTVRCPPPGCIAVYEPGFDLGMRFLFPFIREVSEFFNITVVGFIPQHLGLSKCFYLNK